MFPLSHEHWSMDTTGVRARGNLANELLLVKALSGRGGASRCKLFTIVDHSVLGDRRAEYSEGDC